MMRWGRSKSLVAVLAFALLPCVGCISARQAPLYNARVKIRERGQVLAEYERGAFGYSIIQLGPVISRWTVDRTSGRIVAIDRLVPARRPSAKPVPAGAAVAETRQNPTTH